VEAEGQVLPDGTLVVYVFYDGLIGLQLGALHFSSNCNLGLCSLKFFENAEMTGRSLWYILELAIHQMIILQKQYVYSLFQLSTQHFL
jgi:hypothetical protein